MKERRKLDTIRKQLPWVSCSKNIWWPCWIAEKKRKDPPKVWGGKGGCFESYRCPVGLELYYFIVPHLFAES